MLNNKSSLPSYNESYSCHKTLSKMRENPQKIKGTRSSTSVKIL
jgi:ribosomal protein L24E